MRFNVVEETMSQKTEIEWVDALPVLLTSDLENAAIFYGCFMGFLVREDKDGLVVQLAGVAFRITKTSDPSLGSNVAAVFSVNGVRHMHRRLRTYRVPGLSGLLGYGKQPERFILRDPDGNTLCFVERNGRLRPRLPSLSSEMLEKT